MLRINSQSDDDRQLALRALTWVAYAKRPLFVGELQEALAIEPSATCLDADNLLDLGIVLSVCAGLIIVDETTSVVRLIHYTTQHYFDGIQAREFGMAHSMIAGDCLVYLSFDGFTDMTFNEDVDQDSVQKLLEAHPLVAYSQYFLLHAADAPNQLDLQTGIEDFLEHATSWRSFWRHMFSYELAAPWSFIDWPPTPSFLWISAASGLLQLASRILNEPESAHPDISCLSVAAFYGHSEMVELLLKSGANVNAPAGYYGTVLQASLFWGNQALVQLLINNGADVNVEGGQMGNALQAASYLGREDSIQLLIEHGANVNATAGYYGTALQAASYGGHEVVVRLLLERGANVNAQGGIYGTALRAASRWGHDRVVQLLMDHGADVNSRVKFQGRAMQIWMRGGYEPAGRHLVERRLGIDVNAGGWSYGTALQAASRWGDEGLVRLLLDRDANVNEEGGEYGTALQAAAHGGNKSVVRLLIERGADVNALSGHYGTALQAAAGWGHHEIVRLLIERGSDVNLVGGHYGTPLQAASAWGHLPIVELLVERGADVNATAINSAATVPRTATSAWSWDTTRFFLARGVDVREWDGYYGTALQAASACGHEGVVEYLLEHGATVDASGHHGTALQAAAHEGEERVVRLLVQRGADVNQIGRHGTALHAASQMGHEQIAQWLIEQATDVNT
ncbi:ankyrin repeat-containing domain protein [Mycena galopus ATCC 62051]|nr:ankyrin repeat-containing domain protein [Mycena galopus ATCC 62051]